jgi:hypothetical protein
LSEDNHQQLKQHVHHFGDNFNRETRLANVARADERQQMAIWIAQESAEFVEFAHPSNYRGR